MTPGILLAFALAAPPAPVELAPIPFPPLAGLEAIVAEELGELRQRLEAALPDARLAQSELASILGEGGRLYHAYHLLDAASACYGNARVLAPDDFRWLYLGAVAAQESGDLEGARRGLVAARERAPQDLAVHVRLGEVLRLSGKARDAEAMFRRALELAPGDATAHAGLGEIALAAGKHAAAREHFERALAEAPQANSLHYRLGLAYRGLGDLERARTQLAQRGTIGVRPPDPLVEALEALKSGERVHMVRGRRAFAAGDFRAAVAEFRLALAAAPASLPALLNLGTALGAEGERTEAIELFRRAVEAHPDHGNARFNLGNLLVATGAYSEAVTELTAAARLLPRDFEVCVLLARAFAELDTCAEAVNWQRRALVLATEATPVTRERLAATLSLYEKRRPCKSAS